MYITEQIHYWFNEFDLNYCAMLGQYEDEMDCIITKVVGA